MADKVKLVQEILNSLRRLFQVVNEQSKKVEHKTGLTGPQLWAIKIIAQEEPVMVSDIAEHMYLHPATVVGILDRLEKQGLVLRVRSVHDRRVVRVELSERGKNLVQKSPQVAQGLLVSGLEKQAFQNLESIAMCLDQMVVLLNAQKIPPRLMISHMENKRKTVQGSMKVGAAAGIKAGGRHEHIDIGTRTSVR